MEKVGSRGGQMLSRGGTGGGAGAEQGGPPPCFCRFCLFFSANPGFFARKMGDINLGPKSTPEPGSVPVRSR